jgi:hypothetical protein
MSPLRRRRRGRLSYQRSRGAPDILQLQDILCEESIVTHISSLCDTARGQSIDAGAFFPTTFARGGPNNEPRSANGTGRPATSRRRSDRTILL